MNIICYTIVLALLLTGLIMYIEQIKKFFSKVKKYFSDILYPPKKPTKKKQAPKKSTPKGSGTKKK
jgi:hypothetical protein|tara:strand:+ start:247 stop:444 length:198 start_codon:yes stop_codon:yes gene_type:complete